MSFKSTITDAQDYINNKAEQYGMPSGLLGKENKTRTLNDAAKELLSTIDNTMQRQYLDSGFANTSKTLPNIKNIVTQSPEAIVLIKKKFVSSLSDNYNTELMDKDELHFLRASKQLFKNKCTLISNYEKLTKINNVIKKHGTIVTPIANMIFDTINEIEGDDFNASGGGNSLFLNDDSAKYLTSNKEGIKKIRDALLLGGFEDTTTWITSNKQSKDPIDGDGNGVIELTMVTDFTVSNSLNLGEGNCSLNVIVPYDMFRIDENDIEQAIFQSSYTKFPLYNVAAELLQNEVEQLKVQFNNIRNQRGASSVSYKINISSVFYNKVVIIMDRIGLQITNDDGTEFYKDKLNDFNESKFGNYPAFEKLTKDEFELLKNIYKKLFKIINLRQQDYVDYRTYNKNVNNVRKRMMLNYMGKQVIQAMDTITIFVDSQKVDDTQVLGGLGQTFTNFSDGLMGDQSSFASVVKNMFGSSNFAGMLNKTALEIKRYSSSYGFNNGYSITDNALKNILVGKEFPIWLWNVLRNNFVSSDFGTCIFCGVINTVRSSNSDGNYKLSISAKDNSVYFEQGYINTKPSVYQWNGALYDPITPFDFEYDETTGATPAVSEFHLLEENAKLLSSGKIRLQDGKNAGQIATESTYNDVNIEPKTALSQLSNSYSQLANKIFTPPDGFVYRWKQGIATAIINQSGTPDGLMSSKLVQDDVALVTQEDPFGGQDLVNIISILVCGEPYDFYSFMRCANNFGSITTNPNFNPSTDYFQGLFKRIKNQNKIWGNFIPFAKVTTDPNTFGVQLALQTMYFAQSSSIKQKQQEKATLLNKLMEVSGNSKSFDPSSFVAPINYGVRGQTTITTSNLSISVPIIKRILELDAEIQLHQQNITESLSQSDLTKSSISIVGNNLYFSDTNDQTKKEQNRSFKMKIAEQNEVMKRRLWQVKGNCDNNLFIVGSEYSSDYDIQSIAQNLAQNYNFIDTNWSKIKDKLNTAITPTGMELFINSQGHLELRTPKYNRIPSSVLFEMLKRKELYGIQIYPTFLESLFKNKANAIFEEIEILEDKIRLALISLGCPNDDNTMATSGYLQTNSNFVFLTNSAGTLTDLQNAVDQISEDYKQKDSDWIPIQMTNEVADFFSRNENKYNGAVSNLKQAANTKNHFDINTQLTNYQYILSQSSTVSLYNSYDTLTQKIRERLAKKLGQPIETVQRVDEYLPNSKNGKINPVDINNIQTKLQQYITQRYEAICFAVNIIKNLDNASRINSPDNSILSKVLMPNLLGDNNIPDFLYDMIEDENFDDFGYGSGHRFILENKDIISIDTEENEPEFTSINVSGSELGGLVGGNGFQVGDMPLANVWATDYDLWRMYGFKESQSSHKPYLSNPELQLAPYAIFLLNQQRAKILSATINIVGNEAVQVGENYYVKSLGMLYYAQKVQHSFSYGSNFTTSIQGTYGHIPGEYIPTPLDIIGKNMYNNQHFNIGNYRIARTGTIGNNVGTSLGTFVLPSLNSQDPSFNIYKADSIWGPKNAQTILDIQGKISYLSTTTLPQKNSKFDGICVRIYSKNSQLYNAALFIVSQLLQIVPKAKIIGGDVSNGEDNYIPGDVMICAMNKAIKSINKPRNPSSKAWEIARNMVNITYPNYDLMNKDQITQREINCLENNIIDIWIEDSLVPNDAIIEASQKTPETNVKGETTVKSSLLASMYDNYNKLKASKTTAESLSTANVIIKEAVIN